MAAATDRPLQGISKYAGVAALCALALILRLPGLTESLWYDELWSTRVKLGSVGDFLRSALIDIHPPLYGAIMLVWTRVFGDSELAIRALPMLAGLTTIALMPALGAQLASRPAGWLSGVLLALSPVHIWYSQEARAYAVIMLVAVLLVLQWHRLDEESSRRAPAFWFVIISVALAQLHYYTVALPAALSAVAILQRRNRRVALLALALSVLGVGALLVVKTAAGALSLETVYLRAFDLQAAEYLFKEWFPLGGSVSLTPEETSIVARIVGWSFFAIATAAFLLWLAGGWRFLRRDRWLEHVMMFAAVPGVLVALAIVGRDNYYIERSALPSLPFYFLAVGAGVSLIPSRFARIGAIIATVVFSVAVLSHYHTRRDVWTVYKPNPDWRAIVAPLLEARGAPSRPLAVFSAMPLAELVYYAPGAEECPWPTPTQSSVRPRVSGIRGTLARLFPERERLTCGPGGTASVRIYTAPDSGSAWIEAIRVYEHEPASLVILQDDWRGWTSAVLRSLTATGRSVRSIARSRDIELFVIE